MDPQRLTAHIEQVGEVLHKIDSDPDVLAAFKELLEGILGRSIVLEGAANLRGTSPAKLKPAGLLLAPLPSSYAPFGCSPTDPDNDPFAESTAWRYLKCFMDALTDTIVPGSTFLNAADPVLATGIANLAVRSNISQRCIINTEACLLGEDPVLNKFNQGDLTGAYKTARLIAPAPTPTDTPAPTAMPSPTPIPLMPTPAQTPGSTSAPIAASGFSGTWVGRYSGTILYTPTECKSAITIEGPITAKLVQEGTRVTGTVTLGGTEVEIVRNGSDCKVINRKDDTFTIVGGVSGDTLSYSGPTSSFRVTKASENSADGTSRDEFIVISFFIGRLR